MKRRDRKEPIRQRIAAKRAANGRVRAERNRKRKHAEREASHAFKRRVRRRFLEKIAARLAAAEK